MHRPQSTAFDFVVGSPLADAEDHEFCGMQGSHTDQDDEPAIVDVMLRHRGAVTLHKVSFVRFASHQSSTAPLIEKEIRNNLTDVLPQVVAIGFENDPLGAVVDGVFEISKVAADGDILPFGVGTDGAGTPDAITAALEKAQSVDAEWIENFLLSVIEDSFKASGKIDNFVGWSFGNTARQIVARQRSRRAAG